MCQGQIAWLPRFAPITHVACLGNTARDLAVFGGVSQKEVEHQSEPFPAQAVRNVQKGNAKDQSELFWCCAGYISRSFCWFYVLQMPESVFCCSFSINGNCLYNVHDYLANKPVTRVALPDLSLLGKLSKQCSDNNFFYPVCSCDDCLFLWAFLENAHFYV
jgi:hypothetical protein